MDTFQVELLYGSIYKNNVLPQVCLDDKKEWISRSPVCLVYTHERQITRKPYNWNLLYANIQGQEQNGWYLAGDILKCIGRDGVSNHQPPDCLLNRLFRRRSKNTSKLRVTGFCAGNSPVTGKRIWIPNFTPQILKIYDHSYQCFNSIFLSKYHWS